MSCSFYLIIRAPRPLVWLKMGRSSLYLFEYISPNKTVITGVEELANGVLLLKLSIPQAC